MFVVEFSLINVYLLFYFFPQLISHISVLFLNDLNVLLTSKCFFMHVACIFANLLMMHSTFYF